MITTRRTLAVIALGMALAGAYQVFADAASDALAKAPAPVQATVKKLIGDNKFGGISTEIQDGKTVYDVEFSVKGTDYAADIDASGNILEREVDIDLSVVPPAVLDAVKKAHPDGKIGESSIVTAGDKMFYGLEIKVGNDTHAMEISASGNIIADAIAPAETPL